MADYLRDELGKMLDRYDEQRRAVLAREQKLKDDDARFLEQFVELRRNVVRPVFEAAAAMLAARGHKVSITEQEFSVDVGGKVAEAGISIHIVPSGTGSPGHAEQGRSLSISTRHYSKTLWINAGKPPEGVKDTYPLSRIDQHLVEAELIRFVGAIVGG
jgi:hypothetical protein